MGRVGGYNHFNQLGVGSSMLAKFWWARLRNGYGIVRRKHQQIRYRWTFHPFCCAALRGERNSVVAGPGPITAESHRRCAG